MKMSFPKLFLYLLKFNIMRFIERKKKLEYLLYFVEKGRMFSIIQIAKKFNCSERTVKRMISDLKEDGEKIKYSKSLGKFIIEK